MFEEMLTRSSAYATELIVFFEVLKLYPWLSQTS